MNTIVRKPSITVTVREPFDRVKAKLIEDGYTEKYEDCYTQEFEKLPKLPSIKECESITIEVNLIIGKARAIEIIYGGYSDDYGKFLWVTELYTNGDTFDTLEQVLAFFDNQVEGI